MKIEKLTWISEDAKEAELIVSDGVNQCLVFSHPCKFHEGETIHDPLHAMDVVSMMRIESGESLPRISKTEDSYFSQEFVAKIIDLNNLIVAVGEIKIGLDCLFFADAQEGDLIQFDCARLDVW